MRKLLTVVGICSAALVIGHTPVIIAEASAVPGLCEHRGAEHAAQHHMTRKADSRYHVEHGELPTCGLDNDKDSSDHHDDGGISIPRRDSPGFHCTWHGCG